MEKHTPTPWRLEDDHIVAGDGLNVVSGVMWDTDAALIVRAVNSFVAMREALQAVADWADEDVWWDKVNAALALANGNPDAT
tara:strand:- start:5051 stop:5296 length:246 start_codon:yes stop_codon:yes gene_type:complete